MASESENGIAIKDALKEWESKNGKKAEEGKEIILSGWRPPIGMLDETTSTLGSCERLSLSTNLIERLGNMAGLKQLKILSIARNRIKSLAGIEAVAGTLEELWSSFNLIEKLKGVDSLRKLKVLYMADNRVKSLKEVEKLVDLPELRELVFINNPVEEKMSKRNEWRTKVANLLSNLERLDGMEVIRRETVREAEIMEDEEESRVGNE